MWITPFSWSSRMCGAIHTFHYDSPANKVGITKHLFSSILWNLAEFSGLWISISVPIWFPESIEKESLIFYVALYIGANEPSDSNWHSYIRTVRGVRIYKTAPSLLYVTTLVRAGIHSGLQSGTRVQILTVASERQGSQDLSVSVAGGVTCPSIWTSCMVSGQMRNYFYLIAQN